MKSYKLLLVLLILLFGSSSLGLAEGFIASEDNINLLKQDLISEKLQIGKTRLYEIRKYYGDASQITEDEKKITYDYADLRIEFAKKKILRSWEYDTFKDPVYTDDADKLRKDLESEEIAGNNVSYTKIVKDYGEPTDKLENNVDGMQSIYYYGNIKLVFENIITLKKYRIKGYGKGGDKKEAFVAKPQTKEKTKSQQVQTLEQQAASEAALVPSSTE